MAGAEPFHHDGGPAGVLLCHGFTGTPQALRPWAEYLAAAELTVSLPRLPGHGTRWQDCNMTNWEDWYTAVEREFLSLRGRCDRVFVMGLSMGGTLALRIAQLHGRAVDGLVLVNPSVTGLDPRLRLLPLLHHVAGSVPGIAGDIRKPGVAEVAYGRVPLRALDSLRRAWAIVRADLPRVTQPLLLLRSMTDHVVEARSADLVRSRVSCRELTEIVLYDSYHVATLDHDAERVFAASVDFARGHQPAAAGG